MNLNLLLCITASLFLFACGDRPRDIPEGPKIDTEFVTLVKQAQEMSAEAQKWNKQCGEHLLSEDCQINKATLATLFSKYIERAVRYKSEGEDCHSEIRQKIINFNIHIALFNIQCAGQESPTLNCVSASDFIEKERLDLHEQMGQCDSENTQNR